MFRQKKRHADTTTLRIQAIKFHLFVILPIPRKLHLKTSHTYLNGSISKQITKLVPLIGL